MKNLPLTWNEVKDHLQNPTIASRNIPGCNVAKLQGYMGGRGIHFFKIQFETDEIVMPQGVYSDFAGILLQGHVRVYCRPRAIQAPVSGLEECWNRPGWLWHRIEQWILNRTDRLLIAADDKTEKPARQWGRLAQGLRRVLQMMENWALGDPGRNPTSPQEAALRPSRRPGPFRRWLAGWLSRRTHERALAYPTSQRDTPDVAPGKQVAVRAALDGRGEELPLVERVMGVSGALWNLPRSATLVAQPDDQGRPCEFLLLKREVLINIYEQSAAFRQDFLNRFFARELPGLLAENRLFRNSLYADDILKWPDLLSALSRPASGKESPGLDRIRSFLPRVFCDWLQSLREAVPDGLQLHRILSTLNQLLLRHDLYDGSSWPEIQGAEADRLLQTRSEGLTNNQVIRLNRLLLEYSLGDSVKKSEPFEPLWPEEYERLVGVAQADGTDGITVRHFDKGETVFRQGQQSDALYLIVSGTVRVLKDVPGGEMLVNQVERHGYLGISCLQADGRHTATVKAATAVNAVVFTQAAIRRVAKEFPQLTRKFDDEQSRLRDRDLHMQNVDRLPPTSPPEQIATKLLVATNILRIDMDLCTRCDQCVRACAEAHDGQARFRRANPNLRFGKWEVAGACVHCNDAPCQSACPVGAITFVGNRLVQIHRNRCIGCQECVPACPFEVIEMVPPLSLLDMAAENRNKIVANKCDVCLTDVRDPPCVASCPYGAAERGSPRSLFAGIRNWAETLASR